MANPTLDLIEEIAVEGKYFRDNFGSIDPHDIEGSLNKFEAKVQSSARYQDLVLMGLTVGDNADTFVKEHMLIGTLRAIWSQYMYPVFRLSEDLTGALFLTDTSKTLVEEVNFPFPAVCLQVPAGYIPFNEKDFSGSIRLVFCCRYQLLGKEILFLQAICPEVRRILWSRWPVEKFNNEDVFNMRGPHITRIFKNEPEIMDTDGDTLAASLRLVLNTCIWINSQKVITELPPTPWRSNRRQARVTGAVPTLWSLGNEIKLSSELRLAAKEAVFARKDEWELKYQSVTRGHNQRYHTGEGRKDVTWKWKEPYIRGAQNETSKMRVYTG